jgi:hypothetical protein
MCEPTSVATIVSGGMTKVNVPARRAAARDSLALSARNRQIARFRRFRGGAMTHLPLAFRIGRP